MTTHLRQLGGVLIGLAGLHGGAAWAVMACSISAAPALVTGIYSSAANLDIQGAFSVNCTRALTDPRKPTLWLGINQATTGGTMTRDVGGSTLPYTIYRQAFGSSVWTNTGSKRSNQPGDTGMEIPVDFGNTGTTVNLSIPFYWRVASGLTRAAGIYLDPGVAATLRIDNEFGTAFGTTSIGSRANIQHDCHFLTPPASSFTIGFNLAYTAFQPTPVTDSRPYYVTCTQGTSYTLALDLTRSVIPNVNLAYSLSLTGSTSGTGTGVQQTGFGVNVSIDAGQAGSCSVLPCIGTDTRTITITY